MMLMAAGYTPLHMAVGYSRTATVQVLLDFGADPEVADKEGRNVVELVEKLRAAMPLTPELLGRRTMLENVAGVLTGGLHKTPHGLYYKDDRPKVAEQDRNQATCTACASVRYVSSTICCLSILFLSLSLGLPHSAKP